MKQIKETNIPEFRVDRKPKPRAVYIIFWFNVASSSFAGCIINFLNSFYTQMDKIKAGGKGVLPTKLINFAP